jgi:hypothetical protein
MRAFSLPDSCPKLRIGQGVSQVVCGRSGNPPGGACLVQRVAHFGSGVVGPALDERSTFLHYLPVEIDDVP